MRVEGGLGGEFLEGRHGEAPRGKWRERVSRGVREETGRQQGAMQMFKMFFLLNCKISRC